MGTPDNGSIPSYDVEPARDTTRPLWPLLALIYVVGVLVATVHWGSSLGRAMRVCRFARPAKGFDDVLIAERTEITVPFTFGWRKPMIILPADCLDWSDSRRDAVILHERSHVKRNDWIWQSAAAIAAALQWFNPAAWFLAAKLRATAEEAADNEVLAAGVAPSAYARQLIAFAASRPGPELAVTAMARQRSIAMRLRFILAANRARKPAHRGFVLASSCGFGVVAMALAACVAVPAHASVVAVNLFRSQAEAKFSDGVKVSVVYVGPAESSDLPVWRYDGSPAGGTGQSLSSGGRYSAPAKHEGKRGVVVAFDLAGMPPRDRDTDPFRILVARLGGQTDLGGGSSGAVRMHVHNHYYVPEAWSLADLQVGRGMGPYKQVADNREGQGKLDVQVVPMGETHENRLVNGRQVESSHVGSDVKFTLPDSVKDKDWRLLAFDGDGNPLELHVGYRSEWSSPDHRTASAHCNAAPETIERFVLEARDYQWVTIKNLHLYPNQSTIHP